MQHGGREGGEYLADAWDLQALLEEAESTNKDLVGALLDYEKFFDRFEPRLVKRASTSSWYARRNCQPNAVFILKFEAIY